MKLTENFSLEEMTVSEIGARRGLDNTPNATEISNLVRTALLLEQVRALVKKPIIINSAYRSKAVNDAVGSKDTSQHRIGCAADIRVPGMTPKQVVETHISVPDSAARPPRKQALIIDRNGTRPYQ